MVYVPAAPAACQVAKPSALEVSPTCRSPTKKRIPPTPPAQVATPWIQTSSPSVVAAACTEQDAPNATMGALTRLATSAPTDATIKERSCNARMRISRARLS